MDRYGKTAAVGEAPRNGGRGWQMPEGAGDGHHGHGNDQDTQVRRRGYDQESEGGPNHATGEDGPPGGLHLVDNGPANLADCPGATHADA